MNDYIELYARIFQEYPVEFKEVHSFETEAHTYDAIILFTDDDRTFPTDSQILNNKTICIDHYYLLRRPILLHHIAVRPYSPEYARDWAFPTYPIVTNRTIEKMNDIVRIVLIGGVSRSEYCIDILNRLKCPEGKQIHLHVIRRFLNLSHFGNLDSRIQLHIHENIPTKDVFEICNNSDYAITDVSCSLEYEEHTMSGAIPLYVSLLVPLILSKQTNAYYQFRNVIEFDKHSTDDIVLTNVDISLLETERESIVSRNFDVLTRVLERIRSQSLV
jgi:hypothetical protein